MSAKLYVGLAILLVLIVSLSTYLITISIVGNTSTPRTSTSPSGTTIASSQDTGRPLAATFTTSGSKASSVNTDIVENVIEVYGSGVAYATPDRVSIVLCSQTEEPIKDPREAYANVITVAAKAIDAIKELEGVEKIVTLEVKLYPYYRWVSGSRIFEGYHAIYRFSVEVSDLDVAGEVIAKAVDSGINVIESLRLTFSREAQEKLYEEALKNAVEDAKSKAEAIASNLNLKIVGVKTVKLQEYIPPREVYPIRFKVEAVATPTPAPATPIEAGEIAAAKVYVLVVFQIEQA